MERHIIALLGALVVGCGSSGSKDGGDGDGGGDGLLEEYVLDDQDLVPESGDFDSVTRAFYVGSFTEGTITRIDADGTESVIYSPPPGGLSRGGGVAIDAQRRRLWMCISDPSGELTSQIWVVSLETEERTNTLDLPAGVANASCNDIAVDSAGLAYITDSATPNIYRGDLDAEEIAVWSQGAPFPGAGLFGLNGIEVTEDDQYVLASSTLPVRLFRVVLANPAMVAEIDVTGDLGPENSDGMSILGGEIYLAFESAVRRFSTTDDWLTASFGSTSTQSGLSTVIRAEGRAYAVYADIITAVAGQGSLNPPFRIFRVDDRSYQ